MKPIRRSCLAALTRELDRSGAEAPAAVRALVARLEDALAAVAAQQRELASQRSQMERLTELSRQQLDLLRRSVDTQDDPGSGPDAIGSGGLSSASAQPVNSVEEIAAEIQRLQGRVAESRRRQEETAQRADQLQRRNEELIREAAEIAAERGQVAGVSGGGERSEQTVSTTYIRHSAFHSRGRSTGGEGGAEHGLRIAGGGGC